MARESISTGANQLACAPTDGLDGEWQYSAECDLVANVAHVSYTSHGQKLSFFKGLKVESQQRPECLFVRRLGGS